MGLFDEIWWEAELPAGHPPAARLFQTKSLHNCLEHYVVTAEGRLCLVGNGWIDEEPFEGRPGKQEIVDIDLHGDIRLGASAGEYKEYIARFTHGTLEWIRPIADVPEIVRSRV